MIRKIIPSTLIGRSIIIIFIPIIIIVLLTSFVFYQTSWSIISKRLTESVAADINVLVKLINSDLTDNVGSIPADEPVACNSSDQTVNAGGNSSHQCGSCLPTVTSRIPRLKTQPTPIRAATAAVTYADSIVAAAAGRKHWRQRKSNKAVTTTTYSLGQAKTAKLGFGSAVPRRTSISVGTSGSAVFYKRPLVVKRTTKIVLQSSSDEPSQQVHASATSDQWTPPKKVTPHQGSRLPVPSPP